MELSLVPTSRLFRFPISVGMGPVKPLLSPHMK
jgi:hypothetical protein